MSKTRNGNRSTKKRNVVKVATKKILGKAKRKTAKRGKVQCGGSGVIGKVYQRHKAKRAVKKAQKQKKDAEERRAADLQLRTTQQENKFEARKTQQQKEKEEISEKIKEITELSKNASENSSKSFYENEKKKLEEEQTKLRNYHKSQTDAFKDSKDSIINHETKSKEEDNKRYKTDYESSVIDIEVEKYKQRIEPKIINIKRLHGEIERIFDRVEGKKSIAEDGDLPTMVAEELHHHYREKLEQMHSEFLNNIIPASLRTVVGTDGAINNPIHENASSNGEGAPPIAKANQINENKLAAVSDLNGQKLDPFSKSDSSPSYFDMFRRSSSVPTAKPVVPQEAQLTQPVTQFLAQTGPGGDKIPKLTTPVTIGKQVKRYNNNNAGDGISIG